MIRWTNEALLERIREEVRITGQLPAALKMRNPTLFLYRKRFGSWRNACRLAGFVPRTRGGARRGAFKPKLTLRQEVQRSIEITEAKKRYWEGRVA